MSVKMRLLGYQSNSTRSEAPLSTYQLNFFKPATARFTPRYAQSVRPSMNVTFPFEFEFHVTTTSESRRAATCRNCYAEIPRVHVDLVNERSPFQRLLPSWPINAHIYTEAGVYGLINTVLHRASRCDYLAPSTGTIGYIYLSIYRCLLNAPARARPCVHVYPSTTPTHTTFLR